MRAVVVVSVLLVAIPAAANPRALPFTYTTDTLAPGNVEIEQFVDLTPLRALYASSTDPVKGDRFLASQFQTEIEIGLAERLELGLYVTFVPTPSGEPMNVAAMFEGNGLKQRLRYILADPGTWPVDVGLYGELAENDREVELEGKLLLQRRFDRLRVAANLWAEYELYFSGQRDIVINPTLGATYEVTPRLHVGIDSWLRGEYPRDPPPPVRIFALGPEYYVGPAVMFNFGKLWWSVACYARVTDLDHELVPGEAYGPVWIRSMIGYEL